MKIKTNSTVCTKKIRCPRLGHMIRFDYCRIENRGLPCFKALDCWHEHFSVEEHLKQQLSSQEWQRIFCNPAKPKLMSLVEIIEEAKKMEKKS